MVDWNDPTVIETTAVIFSDMTTFLLGLYGWHFLVTLKTEWRLLRGRLSFGWPYVPYFLGRYTLLALLLMLYGTSRSHVSIHCEVAFRCSSAIGNLAVAFASMNLCLRTVAVWFHNRRVLGLLAAMSIVHASLAIFFGVRSVETVWDPQLNACILTQSRYQYVAAFYLYTIAFDMLVLVLTVLGLYRVSRRNELYSLICIQGVWYVVLTLTVNIPAMVLAWLDLSTIMNVLLAPPASTISIMASSQIVLSLVNEGVNRNSILAGNTHPDSHYAPPRRALLNFEHEPKFSSRIAVHSGVSEVSDCPAV